MRVSAHLRRSTLLLALIPALASCRLISGPEDLEEEGLDGTWTLERINGQVLLNLTPGFPLPGRPDYLRGANLSFTTTIAWGGVDSPELLHEGAAVGAFVLGDAQGATTAGETNTGAFEFDPDDGSVILTALGRSVSGTRSADRLTFTQQNVPLLGTVTLQFRKLVVDQ
jgi:hypothetical protein